MRNYKFLSFFVFIILSFCLSGFAQNVDKNEQTPEEKQNEIEVTNSQIRFWIVLLKLKTLPKSRQSFSRKILRKDLL